MKNFGRSALILAAAGVLALTGCSTGEEGVSGESAGGGNPSSGSSADLDTSRAGSGGEGRWFDNVSRNVGNEISLDSGSLTTYRGSCLGDDIACVTVSVSPNKGRVTVDESEAEAEIRSSIVAVDSGFEKACESSGWKGASGHVAKVSSVRVGERGRSDSAVEMDLIFGTMSSPLRVVKASDPSMVCTQDKQYLTALDALYN